MKLVTQKIDLEDIWINGEAWKQPVSKSVMGQIEYETETGRSLNQILILSSFICLYQVVMIEQCD